MCVMWNTLRLIAKRNFNELKEQCEKDEKQLCPTLFYTVENDRCPAIKDITVVTIHTSSIAMNTPKFI